MAKTDTPELKETALPPCVICDSADELFPEWDNERDHTPKERGN